MYCVADTHVYCAGYIDKNAIWNNGFYCPRWGGPDETYCCGGDGREKYCCPEVHQAPTAPSSTAAAAAAAAPAVTSATVTSPLAFDL